MVYVQWYMFALPQVICTLKFNQEWQTTLETCFIVRFVRNPHKPMSLPFLSHFLSANFQSKTSGLAGASSTQVLLSIILIVFWAVFFFLVVF